MELVIVTGIIGIIAVVSMPNLSSTDQQKLDMAVAEVVAAIRFARSEAMRTAEPHGLKTDTSPQRIQLYWLDTSGAFPVPTYNVRHPVDKNLYDLNFSSNPMLKGVSLSNVEIQFNGQPPTEYMGFDSDGRPKYDTGSTTLALSKGKLTLEYRGLTRQVAVTPANGRVVVQ